MEIKKQTIKKHQFVTVKNNADLVITFCSFGASIYLVKYKDKVITYHPDNYERFFKAGKYFGKTLGRVAGRINGAKIIVSGKNYQLDKNEKKNTLHGGFKGLSFREFETVVNETDELVNVVFKYTSPHLECGFPGEVRFIIVYSVSKKSNYFNIHYHALTNKVTPVSLSTHTYWRLLGNNVLDHKLFIDADEMSKNDLKTQVVLGKKKVNKIFDFRKAHPIGDFIKEVAKVDPKAGGYDHFYLLNKGNKAKIILTANHIKLSVNTDFNAVNIFTNSCPPGPEVMKEYGKDKLYGSIAIEPQIFPSSIREFLITPEKPFDRFISFMIEDK